MEVVNNARYAMYDDKCEVIMLWKGNSYINVFNEEAIEVAAWAIESKDAFPSLDEVIASMVSHMEASYYPY